MLRKQEDQRNCRNENQKIINSEKKNMQFPSNSSFFSVDMKFANKSVKIAILGII